MCRMGAERAGDENVRRRPSTSPYDRIAELYDPWSRSVVEDVDFYVDLAIESGGPVVTCPFRAYLHLDTDTNRLRALGAARDLLAPGGRFVFDVFHPAPDDVAATHGRWIEREPEIFERAEWNEADRTLTLAVRGPDGAGTLRLAWISAGEWHDLLVRAGFDVEALYGWFDRRPYAGGEDSIWVARRLD